MFALKFLYMYLYIHDKKQDYMNVKITSSLTALNFQQIKHGTTDNLHNE